MRNLKQIKGLARLKGTLLFKTTENQSRMSRKGQAMKPIFVFWYNFKIMVGNPCLALPGFLLIIHILINSYNIISMKEPY